jgi:hypothetical protein
MTRVIPRNLSIIERDNVHFRKSFKTRFGLPNGNITVDGSCDESKIVQNSRTTFAG